MIRRSRLFRLLFRRGVAIASLLALAATTVGIPVVQRVTGPGGKDISQPFPCMDSHCGCMNATACWQGCCCHTNREKLAWARKHGVTPPKYVVAAAIKERAPVSTASCCSTNCCNESEDRPEDVDAANESWQLSFVPAIAARCCHGLPQLWLILSAALPVPDVAKWQPDFDSREAVVFLTASIFANDDQPPTPPPNA